MMLNTIEIRFFQKIGFLEPLEIQTMVFNIILITTKTVEIRFFQKIGFLEPLEIQTMVFNIILITTKTVKNLQG